MDHAYFTDRISAFHDNDLPAQERVVIEEHLAGCAECQGMLDQFRRLDAVVAKHVELGGTDYWEKLARKTEARLGFTEATPVTDIRPKSRFGTGWKLAAAAASFAALSFFAYHQMDIATEDEIIPRPGEVQRATQMPEAPRETVQVQSESRDAIEPAESDEGNEGESRQDQTQPQTGAGEERAPVMRKPTHRMTAPSADVAVQKAPPTEGEAAAETPLPIEDRAASPPQDLQNQTLSAERAKAEALTSDQTENPARPEPIAKRPTQEPAQEAEATLSAASEAQAKGSSATVQTASDSSASLRAERDALARLLSKHFYASSGIRNKAMAPQAYSQAAPDTVNYDTMESKYLGLCDRLIDSTTDTAELGGMRDLIQKIADRPNASHRTQAVSLLGRIDAR